MNWIKILIWMQIFVIVVLAKDQHKKPKYKYKGMCTYYMYLSESSFKEFF